MVLLYALFDLRPAKLFAVPHCHDQRRDTVDEGDIDDDAESYEDAVHDGTHVSFFSQRKNPRETKPVRRAW